MNVSDRDSCKGVDINKRWNDASAAAAGTLAETSEAGVMASIAGCGVCFYKTCRPDDKSPVPQTANLV